MLRPGRRARPSPWIDDKGHESVRRTHEVSTCRRDTSGRGTCDFPLDGDWLTGHIDVYVRQAAQSKEVTRDEDPENFAQHTEHLVTTAAGRTTLRMYGISADDGQYQG